MSRPVTLARSEVHELTSRHAEADYQLWVAAPTQNPRTAPARARTRCCTSPTRTSGSTPPPS